MMKHRLYHVTSLDDAMRIVRDGFKDGNFRLSDRALAKPTECVIEALVNLPTKKLRDLESAQKNEFVREWIIPGKLLNAAKVRTVSRGSELIPGKPPMLRVHQDHWDICDKPLIFFTQSMGPCIGVCIAYKCWASIAHCSMLNEDYPLLILPLIAEAKVAIPRDVIRLIQPIVCGGDKSDEGPDIGDDDPKETQRGVLRSRKRIIEILRDAGFGEPLVRWNDWNETTHLFAYLHLGKVNIEDGSRVHARWPILTSESLGSQRSSPKPKAQRGLADHI